MDPMLRIVVELLAPLRNTACAGDLGRVPIGRFKFQSFGEDVAQGEAATLHQVERPRDVVANLIVETTDDDGFGRASRETARPGARIPRLPAACRRAHPLKD